ncbi:MSHA biogenesis protein MshJ [Marinobacter sp. LV10R520-4]|uniref:type II secretion system protein GspM n=1 Tax=Marinobacter sp. LV10R520-4 TaxID=1761796 RepID=UPI000BF33A72|nr:type II secretion system protein GspM [Marinobacter sp. LV10R520-4]PFG52124.1 MSHA biogenesis protein MshJ [Marinobacter sp. LV10R520-4]
MSSPIKQLQQRWQAFAPREQWLAYGVGVGVVGLLYMQLLADPWALRLDQQKSAYSSVEARSAQNTDALAELAAALAADPNLSYNNALSLAAASHAQLLEQIDQHTRELVSPQQMRALLTDLLHAQPGLQLVSLENFSEAVQLPPTPVAEGTPTNPATSPGSPVPAAAPASEVSLYRHGMRLKLEGNYFDLLRYLQTIQNTAWKLNWESLHYQVGEAGPGKAQISLQLYTLSRHAESLGA